MWKKCEYVVSYFPFSLALPNLRHLWVRERVDGVCVAVPYYYMCASRRNEIGLEWILRRT